MASTWYPLFLQSQFERPVNSDISGATVLKLALLTSAYTYSAAHQFRSSLSGVIGTPVALSAKAYTSGNFAATVANYLGSELNGQTATQAVIYIDSGSAATDRLVLHLGSAPGFPLTGLGEDQPISFPATPIGLATGSGDIWYPLYLEHMLQRAANTDLVGGAVKVVAVDLGTYTYSAAHRYLSDLTSGARVGTPQTLGTKTFVNGVFKAANISFPAFTGASVEALAAYVDSGSEATSPLVLLKRNVQGMPLTPNGSAQAFNWNATDGLHKLGATAA